MTDQSKEHDREAFEAALLADDPQWNVTRDSHGDYAERNVRFVYIGWKYARATQASAPADPAVLIERMRTLEADHGPDGWPAVRMRDISALCDLAARATAPADVPEEAMRLHADAAEERAAQAYADANGHARSLNSPASAAFIEFLAAHRRAQPPATTADTWPIAKLTVAGDTVTASFYTPGLPDGEHDVWPCPVAIDHEAVAERAAELHDKAAMPLADALELALSEAGAAGAEPAGWLPIADAPKDCAFLGYQPLHGGLWLISPMYWSCGVFLILQFHNDNTEHEVSPTHWMPLPPAPQQQGGGK